MRCVGTVTVLYNPLWPNNAIWHHRFGTTLTQVMACCLMAPSHYLNQCWLFVNEVLWHSPESNFRASAETTSLKIILLKLEPHLPGANELIVAWAILSELCVWVVFLYNYKLSLRMIFIMCVFCFLQTGMLGHPGRMMKPVLPRQPQQIATPPQPPLYGSPPMVSLSFILISMYGMPHLHFDFHILSASFASW